MLRRPILLKNLRDPVDYSEAIAHLSEADSTLAQLIERVGQCHLDEAQHTGDLLHSLSRTIIHQQLSIKVAATIHCRFLQIYAPHPYPTADLILSTSDETLRGAGISRSKIIYLKDLAQNIIDGLPDVDELAILDDETIIDILTQVKGIGRWSAQMLLIFRLHRLNVLPTDDLGVRTGIRILYKLNELPNKKTVERIGQLWRPYCSIAAWYLWRSLDMTQP
ncbi:MAG: DNA-3-methyladenine glycosylase family protein [Elainellaceae cyanobacterium]